MQEVRNKIEADIVLIAFDINKSANFLNNDEIEYSRFLKTQKLIRDIDEIQSRFEERQASFCTCQTHRFAHSCAHLIKDLTDITTVRGNHYLHCYNEYSQVETNTCMKNFET